MPVLFISTDGYQAEKAHSHMVHKVLFKAKAITGNIHYQFTQGRVKF
jgi:hypothetical protein